MHPLSFAPRGHQTGASQVGQMAADLRLIGLKDFHKEADANFVLADEVQQAQPRAIGQRQKEPLHIKCLFHDCHCTPNTYDLTYMTVLV